MRTRGWIRTIDIEPVPGKPSHYAVELHLTDASNVEQYCHWKGPHFVVGGRTESIDLRHGDDVEIVLISDGRGGYTRDSYVHNHTRGVRYTFAPPKAGCLTVLALLALVGAAPAAALAGLASDL